MNNNQTCTPITIDTGIKLSAADHFYFAVSRQDVAKNLIYVYTLACPSDGHGRFYLNPITEVATFSSCDAANSYVNAVSGVMAYQSQYPGHATLCRALSAERRRFRQNTR